MDRNLTTLGGSGVGSVALRKESVDRNVNEKEHTRKTVCRSPQGERG